MKTLIVAAATLAAFICAAAPAAAQPESCERGEFCLWTGESFEGDIHRVALENANPGECVPLPDDFDARSFANLTKRPVTVYQDRECSTEAEFDTYPGGGTLVPQAPYVVRGVQIWEY